MSPPRVDLPFSPGGFEAKQMVLAALGFFCLPSFNVCWGPVAGLPNMSVGVAIRSRLKSAPVDIKNRHTFETN